MKYYSYFPGCSTAHGGAKAYDISTKAVAKVLDTEFVELEGWNCCGSTPYASVDELASYCCSARNLALAEKRGFDLVTPCSACYVLLTKTNMALKEYPELRAKVKEALAAGKLEYNGGIKVHHLLGVFANDIGYEKIKSQVKVDLKDLKVAPYYGCQIVRPSIGFDHPEQPKSLDNLITSLGGEAISFPLKSRCCGGSLILSEEETALELLYKLFQSAAANGAQCIITVCPLCQTNLDVYQNKINRKFKTNFNIPILFFTQLMGIAFAIESKQLGLEKCIISADKVLAGFLSK
jgi:heterodisulfide reductase subunit B